MSRIDAATRRIEQAIDRLERAVSAGGGSRDQSGLEAGLTALRAEYAELSKVTDEVSAKLDHAIGRLKLVLEA